MNPWTNDDLSNQFYARFREDKKKKRIRHTKKQRVILLSELGVVRGINGPSIIMTSLLSGNRTITHGVWED